MKQVQKPILTSEDLLEYLPERPVKLRYSQEEYHNLYHTIAIIQALGSSHEFNLLPNLKFPDYIREVICVCFSKLHYYVHAKSIYPDMPAFNTYRFIDEIEEDDFWIRRIHNLLDHNRELALLLPNLVEVCAPLIKFYTLMYRNGVEQRDFYNHNYLVTFILEFLNGDFNFNDTFNNDELLNTLVFLIKDELENPLENSQIFTTNINKVRNHNNTNLRIFNIIDYIDKIAYENTPLDFAKHLKYKNEFFNTLFILDYCYCQENNLQVYTKSLNDLKNSFTSYGGTLNFSRHTSWRKGTAMYDAIMERIHILTIHFNHKHYINGYLKINWIKDYFLEYQDKYNTLKFCVLRN